MVLFFIFLHHPHPVVLSSLSFLSSCLSSEWPEAGWLGGYAIGLLSKHRRRTPSH